MKVREIIEILKGMPQNHDFVIELKDESVHLKFLGWRLSNIEIVEDKINQQVILKENTDFREIGE